MNKFLKNYGKYIIVGIGIVIFGIIATLLLIDKITPFDNIIYNAIISLKSDSVTNFFKLITKLCNEKFIIIATVLIFIILFTFHFPPLYTICIYCILLIDLFQAIFIVYFYYR